MATKRESMGAKGLVAVVLVTRSRPGPHVVFSYPPISRQSGLNSNGVVDQSDSDEDSNSDSDVRNERSVPATDRSNVFNANKSLTVDATASIGKNDNPQDNILGFSEDTLQRLLSPGCWSDRKKFEICLDGFTFVGYPIYAAQDGSWARKHSHADDAPRQRRRSSTPTPSNHVDQAGANPQTAIGITITEPRTPAKQAQDFTHVPESFDSHGRGLSLATSFNSGSEGSGAVIPEQLTMFHVVFVLGSSSKEKTHLQVLDIYNHVAKKLSKAIQYCQNQSQYLGIESKKLLALKAKARHDGITDPVVRCEQMLEGSELAWALKEVYERISTGEIAGIRLNGMPLSLQIPLPISSVEDKESELTRYSGLLLLEDRDVLLHELAHPDASPLVYFIREHTPTKSLQKHAVNLSMPIEDILSLAQHLVKWRKGRVINPLHQRNTYIVGRNAPLDQLQTYYIADYAKKFPVLPSLPQVLKVLGGKPIKYGLLIPSRDHRTPYMGILAYLVQHRFVEQLKTFGWLQAPTTKVDKGPPVEEEVNQNRRPLSVASLLSPQLRPVSDDDTMSVSSERTTIPVAVVDAAKRRHNITSSPYSVNVLKDNDLETSKIITCPENLSLEDTQRLQHIRDSVHDDELSDRLPSLLRHFNGESAFEEIAASEGLKRSKMEAWLDILQREHFLFSFRSL